MPRENTREDHRLRDAFFTEGKQLAAAGDPAADCWLCHTPIDYEAKPSTTDDSHNLDHAKSWHDYPELRRDPNNFRHAHFHCNTSRGKRAPTPGLGAPMPDWW
ncbi:hypothetical protein C5B92_07120 [Rathayibacter sp. AY1A4]|uniref:HNH endonuclease n=1 Tax=Rathayibacter sp. AY1A4 TaxID=2080522 RepID=UPI000CE791E1|nr:HNH endonuclease [Rathayibacter sp. AY1A4]PPF18278.1 hypothetical protein C5B92_07120 [Rathayibacter sp. AY1A4]